MDQHWFGDHSATTTASLYPVDPADSNLHPLHSHRYGDLHAYGNASVQLGDRYTFNHFGLQPDPKQDLLNSLVVPQISERRDQISDACPDTYQWVLRPPTRDQRRWDCFRSWLESSIASEGIYWISGKPGSGKSTLIKFLDQELHNERYLATWADGRKVVRLQHFFWSSGNKLQKSTMGFLRNILVQILYQHQSLINHVIEAQHRDIGANIQFSWTVANLAATVRSLFRSSPIVVFFIIIDGLDECEDCTGVNSDLLKYIKEFSTLSNIKLCVSSRPSNMFQDVFDESPRLKLENLTYSDIQTYVSTSLNASPRWRLLRNANRGEAESFKNDIVSGTEGVFLWAALTVRSILDHLSKGANLDQLRRKLKDIPSDLGEFFTRIIESIEGQHRQAASILFQLASWQEGEYASLTPLRLVDTMFLSLASPEPEVQQKSHYFQSQLRDIERFRVTFDFLLRQLSNCGKGLLELSPNEDVLSLVHKVSDKRHIRAVATPLHDSSRIQESTSLDKAFSVQIRPLHRSLRDFLLEPETREKLIYYTGGKPIDARSWLIEARLIRLVTLYSLGYRGAHVAGLVSFLMCSMSVDNALNGPKHRFTDALSLISSIVENHGRALEAQDFWYVHETYDSLAKENGNFLSMAIDFRLSSYVVKHLTWESIATKQGRPILDHILRPRYTSLDDIGTLNRWPDLAMLNAALENGANPNAVVGKAGLSIWAVYVCFLADPFAFRLHETNLWLEHYGIQDHAAWFDALQPLTQYGAVLFLPYQWISIDDMFFEAADMPERMRIFETRWGAISSIEHVHNDEDDILFAVRDLIKIIHQKRPFPCDVEPFLKSLKEQEEASGFRLQHPVCHDHNPAHFSDFM